MSVDLSEATYYSFWKANKKINERIMGKNGFAAHHTDVVKLQVPTNQGDHLYNLLYNE